jgi:hypothetical protein
LTKPAEALRELKPPAGATLAEIMEATGWQAYGGRIHLDG